MTDTEQRESVRQFINKWQGRGKEDEDDRSYWLDILERVLGVQNATDRIDFQKKVIVDGNTKKIDAYIPETHVLIEQKSIGIPLDKKIHQSGGIDLTPYEQAKRYNDNLPFDEKARWIITSNFSEIWVYDMNMRVPEPVKLSLIDLQSKYSMINFLINHEQTRISFEMQVSQKAGDLVGEIYDALYKQYINPNSERALKSLNMLCVRLVFCMYAEDAGIFSNNNRTMFHDYMNAFAPKDMRRALIDLFRILDTKPEDRDPYENNELLQFPYVNGGLFSDENIEIPNFTDEIKSVLIDHASSDFDWSDISPTIFGAIFESTLNPETRRSGGMHYTSIENIHKVIDPLFLNALKAELAEIKQIGVQRTKEIKLKAFQDKLAALTWFDPACGSGNFLTETFISIRRLENEVINELQHGQIVFGEAVNPIKVSINQFYGIEINDFAVTVAKTALWIAESQMMKETEDIVHMPLDFLPLTTNANIVEDNALLIPWESVVPIAKLSYIMGNPPFIGGSMMSNKQKEESISVLGKIRLANSLDYVCAWYFKAARIIQNTRIRVAFVSTNSITQGEQVAPLWGNLFAQYGISIDFAYRTFQWDSEANIKAHVHCVIIGFSSKMNNYPKLLFTGSQTINAENISPYLIDAPDIIVDSHVNPICDVPQCVLGNTAKDKGYLLLDEEERNYFISKYPRTEQFIRPYIGGRDFLHNDEHRYCFWLKGISPSQYKDIPELKERLAKVKQFREESTSKDTRKAAETPYLFFRTPHIESDYIIIPRTTSQRRRYIPIGFMEKGSIGSDALMVIYDASLYLFGVLMSNVHAAWLRTIGGRLKSDYRYSAVIVYNSFPWPTPTQEQKNKIEQTAKEILNARNLYPDCCLADLYDEVLMPPELRKAHQNNDRAVMQAYGFDIKTTTENKCVSELLKLYKKITDEYSKLTDSVESALDKADKTAMEDNRRYTHDEVFSNLRRNL